MPPTARTPQDRKPPRKRAAAKKAPPAATVAVTEADSKYAPTTWGSQIGAAEDLVVPSGQTALVRRPGVQGLIEAGILHDLDSLSSIVDDKHIKRVEGKPDQINVESVMGDKKQMDAVLHLVDRVCCYVVLKPNVQMTPNDPTSRQPGVIYCDMIDLMDKMFILNFAVGGVRGLEPFRKQFEEALGGVGPQ